MYIAVRVAGSIEQSLRQGYDVEGWVAEGLADVIIPAGNAATDGSIEVAEWKAMIGRAQGRLKPAGEGSVLVWPGFDNGLPRGGTEAPEDTVVGPEPGAVLESLHTRALAMRYLSSGADGIYIFNWHQGARFNWLGDRYSYTGGRALLNEVGAVATLRYKDKVYPAAHRVTKKEGAWRGAFDVDRLWGEVPVPLLPTTTGRGPVITLDLGDEGLLEPEAPPCTVQLRLRLTEWTGLGLDEIAVFWDGEALPTGQIVPGSNGGSGSGPVPLQHFNMAASTVVWHSWTLSPTQVISGKHRCEVALMKRNPQVASQITLTDCEVKFDFDSPPVDGLLDPRSSSPQQQGQPELHAAVMAALGDKDLLRSEGALCCTEAGFVCVKVNDFFIKGVTKVFQQHGQPRVRAMPGYFPQDPNDFPETVPDQTKVGAHVSVQFRSGGSAAEGGAATTDQHLKLLGERYGVTPHSWSGWPHPSAPRFRFKVLGPVVSTLQRPEGEFMICSLRVEAPEIAKLREELGMAPVVDHITVAVGQAEAATPRL